MPKFTQNRRRRDNGRNLRERTQGDTLIHSDLVELRRILMNQNTRPLPTVSDPMEIDIDQSKVHSFKRSFPLNVINFSTVAPVFATGYLTLDAFPNYTDFTSLFDSYRILQAKVTFVPLAKGNAVGLPFYTVIDYDDAATPSSTGEMFQYDTLQISSTNDLTERVFYPRVADAQYTGSTFTGYGRGEVGKWIDSASPNVQHYGIKYALPVSTFGNASGAFQPIVTATIQCKDPR
jgi:hypothetical protein